jgi:hypothetical protein
MSALSFAIEAIYTVLKVESTADTILYYLSAFAFEKASLLVVSQVCPPQQGPTFYVRNLQIFIISLNVLSLAELSS